jgi:RHS repeat-associated protein
MSPAGLVEETMRRLILLFTLCILSPPAFSQGSGSGFPATIPQDCIGGVCTNLQNLAQTVTIPVMSKSGAFPFNYSFAQNFYISETPAGFTPSIFSVDGLFNWSASGLGTFAASALQTNTTCPGGSPATVKYSNWFVLDSFGTQHPLPSGDFADTEGCLAGSGFTAQTIDNSGYTVTVGAHPVVSALYTSGGMSLADETLTDSNNNSGAWNPSTGVYTDTLGMTALTYSTTSTYQKALWTDANGNSPYVKITITTGETLRTNFGCSGISDFYISGVTYPLPTSVSFPDGTSESFVYEGTNGYSGDYTGRLAQVTLRSGGLVKYNWNPNSGANDGMNCTTFIPDALNLTTPDGVISYTTGTNTTTKLDYGKNKTVYEFTSSGDFLTQVSYYPNTGSVATPSYSGTATETDTYCYNGNATSCATASVNLPITEVDRYVNLGVSAGSSRQQVQYDAYGNATVVAQFDFGVTVPFLKTTNTMAENGSGNCSGIAATVNNKICSSKIGNSTRTVAASKFSYSSTGNLLTALYSPNGGTSYVGCATSNSYNGNGTPSTIYDANCNPTNFTYNSSYYSDCTGCTQYPFATARSKGGLQTYAYYNGYIGEKTKDEDANLNVTKYCYNNTTTTSCSSGTVADPWGRIMAAVDPMTPANEVFKTYSVTSLTSAYSFNSGNSVHNTTITLDWAGRTVNTQNQQGPSSSSYDTVSKSFNFAGINPTVFNSNPCSAASPGTCSTYGPTTTLDMWGRATKTVQTGSNATINIAYAAGTSGYDTESILSPAPSGENTKGVVTEENGLGWPTVSCPISSTVSGEVSCGLGGFTANGILTTTAYTFGTGSSTVTSSRGPSNQQQRSVTKDGLGRVTSKTTPEGGTWNYYYDTAACTGGAASAGNLTCVEDPNGNVINYFYDSNNRLTEVNANGSSCRWFYYDNSTGYLGSVPSGYTLANNLGRMVEAATDSCQGTKTSATLITDEWMGDYDNDGRTLVALEMTPNSTQYYESEMTYTGPVLTAVDNASPSLTTFTYGLDGEGRWNSLTNGGTTYVPSSGVTYNAAGQPTNISIGTGSDYDGYAYDNNTLLMTGWTFQVNSIQETGVITPNANNTIESVAITDGFNANGSMTCSYNSSLVTGTGYDDLGRLIGHSCTGSGGTWSQAFSYDQYDNITKSGTGFTPWSPGYSATTNHYTCSGCTYDANGDVTNDGTNAYTWNAFSKLASVNLSGTGCSTSGDCIIYDAFGRVVEFDDGSTKTEIWYTPIGKHFLNGTTSLYGYEAAPGGGTAFGSSYMHKDSMGNARIVSTIASPTVTTDRAFAPYGEVFNIFGGTGQNEAIFNGLNQGIFSGMYDTPNREMTALQGRFMSTDPAGSGWNQYAWPTNPNSFSDPSGLCGKDPPWLCNRESGPMGSGNTYIVDGFQMDWDPYGDWMQILLPAPTDWAVWADEGYIDYSLFGGDNEPEAANNGASNTCAGMKMGKAPAPSYYAAQAVQQNPSNPEQDTSPINMFIAAWGFNNLANKLGIQGFLGFGSLNAQPQGASPAYANYVYGVYMSAAGFSLDYAQTAGNVAAAMTSNYGPGGPPSGYNPTYPSTPNSNVANIAQGYNDQQYGTLCTPTTN